MINQKLEKLMAECDRHLKIINNAYVKMSLFMPLNAEKFQMLNEDEIEHVDQFLFRFSTLQDAICEKLFALGA